VRRAAQTTGLQPSAAEALEARRDASPVWSGAQGSMERLAGRTRLGVVTNCSVRLGLAAVHESAYGSTRTS
jgi:2-haloacid dehalogenase